ncbi:MAG: UMP kinase [Chlamydiia bacterium]|nr:UMP kinase [Chlamydiia bacterium]
MSKRVLLKISGEALKDNSSPIGIGKVRLVGSIINQFIDKGYLCAVVIGGGNIIRGRSGLLKNTNVLDQTGMLSTVINAVMINGYLNEQGINSTVFSALDIRGAYDVMLSLEDAKEAFNKGYVVVCGGGIGVSGVSTDMAASLHASNFDVDMIVKFTNCDGLYDSDPELNSDASKFTKIDIKDAINDRLSAMDVEAMCICEKHGIDIVISKTEENSACEVANGNFSNGTIIISKKL